MIDFSFMTYDHDDGMDLGSVRWPCLPRKGETEVLEGLVARADEGKANPPLEEVVFVVDDIVYRDDMADAEVGPGIEVWLTLPASDAVWTGTFRQAKDR